MKSPFLDPGDGALIFKSKIVLILNAESATLQKDTRNFIRHLNRKGDAVMPKKALRQINSLILTNSHGKDSLYSSSRSAGNLAREEE